MSHKKAQKTQMIEDSGALEVQPYVSFVPSCGDLS
jgi:hypothetical protein